MERFERVYTMTDYYDGPRGGIADFERAPHLYGSLWLDHPDDDDDGRFEPSPVAPEVLEPVPMRSRPRWRAA